MQINEWMIEWMNEWMNEYAVYVHVDLLSSDGQMQIAIWFKSQFVQGFLICVIKAWLETVWF